MAVTASLLNTYLGKHIKDICPVGFHDNTKNHCAHFVAHVLGLEFGYTCEGRANPTRGGANVRVQEIFAQCPWIAEVLTCPPQQSDCLIFVTGLSNVRYQPAHAHATSGTPLSMRNIPKKHIGILVEGYVWHYSNSRRQVACASATDFIYHYQNQKNGLWSGGLPGGSSPQPWGT